jgi:hypothetical protein
MLKTTVGQLLVNQVLPPDLRRYDRILDKKGIQDLLQEVATKHPDKYRQIVFDLSKIGSQVSYATGGNSFGLKHLKRSIAAKAAQMKLQKEIGNIYRSDLSDTEKEQKVVDLLMSEGESLQNRVYDESLLERNPLAHQVLSGARGNKTNLRSLRAGDLLYVDHHNRPIPIPVLKSYSEGLSPAEYFAGSFGARKGVVDTKFCLAAYEKVFLKDYFSIPICLVKPGDKILGADMNGNTGFVTVVAKFDNGLRKCRCFRFEDEITVHATEDHKILALADGCAKPEMVALGDLDYRYSAVLADSPDKPLVRFVGSDPIGEIQTFDLEVDHTDHMFVLENFLTVSNSTQDAGFFCLAEGTSVRMGDFSCKPIEEIAPGDVVLGADKAGNTFPVPVSAVFDNGPRDVHKFSFRCSGASTELIGIAATVDHKILTTKDSCSQPEMAKLGDLDGSYSAVLADSLARFVDSTYVGVERTFDIEVAHPDHLFVLANGAIVSNSKQMTQVAHRLVVTALDRDGDGEPDTPVGLPTSTDDPDNVGALLAVSTGGYPRNTVLNPKIITDLKSKGIDDILVRSPLTGGPPEGGVYGRDLGVREKGDIPPVGDFVGIAAANALGEPLSQSQLCLAEGTLVRMADWSVRPIEAINVGEEVLGADRSGCTFPVRVLRTFNNGPRDCVRTLFRVASTREFIELVSTPDHKLLATARYWSLPHERKICDVLPVAEKCVGYGAEMTTAVSFTGGSAEPYALLLGLLLGDGCYTESVHGVHLSCFDPSLIEDIQPYLQSLGLKAKLLAGQKGYWRISQVRDTVKQDKATGRMLPGDRNPALIKLKFYQMHGKYAHDKVIPEEVWGWDQTSVQQLIAGLYVTDGSLYAASSTRDTAALHIQFGSTSLRMVEQLRDLLRIRFAIHAGRIHSTGSSRKRLLHSLTITRRPEVLKFLDCIPLYGVKKHTAERIVADWKPRLDTDCSKYYRRSQEPVGCLATYDIEVDHPDHLFVLANGLIVSNSSKHSGGVAGAAKGVSGFKLVNQLVQVPKTFKGGAAHAKLDGKVTGIREAPQGGHYITIDNQDHYVATGYNLKVKPGDEVEAGDVISEGIPNPAEIVQYKGIGEGRRYFVNAFMDAYKESGIPAHRRNVELIARGLIDHVRMSDEMEDYLPDDVVQYSRLEHDYRPREGYTIMDPKKAVGMYLEKPTLHYTIGTPIRPSTVKQLQKFGVNNIAVHRDEPPFRAEMVRGMENLTHDPDWMTRFLGSYLQKNLLKGVHRGDKSNELGTSYVPALARAENFGREGLTQGYDPKKVKSLELPPKKPKQDSVLADLEGE